MPLDPDAAKLIRQNLEAIQNGLRVRPVAVGRLTDKQLSELKKKQEQSGFPVVESGNVVFHGAHIYKRRIKEQGYTIDDVIGQIASAMADASVCVDTTAIRNPNHRDDGYGNRVRDKAVFECSQRRPDLELYSIIPTGDTVKPNEAREKEKGCLAAAPSKS